MALAVRHPLYLRRWETVFGIDDVIHPESLAKKMRLRDLEPITVNGLQAATATTRARTSGGNVDPLVAYRIEKDIYRFTVTLTERTAAMSTDLRRLTYSFRRLDARKPGA